MSGLRKCPMCQKMFDPEELWRTKNYCSLDCILEWLKAAIRAVS